MAEEAINQENIQPQVGNEQELATPEQVSEIKRKLLDVSVKNNALNSMVIINKRKLDKLKSKLVQEILIELQKNGVDLNDQVSINDFLNKLDQQNPDLRQLFEIAFDQLSGGSENEINNENNINQNEQGISAQI